MRFIRDYRSHCGHSLPIRAMISIIKFTEAGPMQKIMIVEDDPAIREELALLLENEGYTPLAITEFTDVPGQAAQEGPALIL